MSDLKNESPLTKLEAELNAPVNDLNNELCSVRVAVEPIETPRCSVLPVKRLLPRVMKPVSVLKYENCSASVEEVPSEMVRILGKFLPIEPVVVSEPVRDLNMAVFLERPEFEPNDTMGDLNREIFSVKPETKESEPSRDLKKEDFWAGPGFMAREELSERNRDVCLAKLAVTVHAELKDLNQKDTSAKGEDALSEAFRPLERPLVSEVARASEPARDLKREVCLPRFEEGASEPLRDRNSEFFSTRLEAVENEPASNLKSEFLS